MEILSEEAYGKLREKQGDDKLAIAKQTMDVLNEESIDSLRERLEKLRSDFENELPKIAVTEPRNQPTRGTIIKRHDQDKAQHQKYCQEQRRLTVNVNRYV